MSDKNQQNQKNNDAAERTPRVGALLKASRLRVGEDLRDISEILCIRYLYLEAIEECRYQDLPGETYAVGFIRSFAEHLGLDGEEVVRRYRAEQAGTQRTHDLSFPTPVPDSGVPKGAIVFIGVVLALIIYGGWYVSTTDEGFLSELISPVPDRLKHLVTGNDGTPAGTAITPSTGSQTPAEPPASVSDGQSEAEAMTAEAAAAAAASAADAITEGAEQTAEEETQAEENAAQTASDVVSGVAPTPDSADASAIVSSAAETTEPARTATEPASVATEPASVATETTEIDATTQRPASAELSVEPETVPEPSPVEPTPPASPQPDTAADAPSEPAEITASVEQATTAPVSEPESTATESPVTETAPAEPAPIETASAPTVSDEPAPDAAAENVPQPSADDLNARVLEQASGRVGITEEPTPPAASADSETSVQDQQTTPVTATSEIAAVPPPSSSGIVIRAVDSSWVEIKNPLTGEVVFTGLLGAGTTYDVPDVSGLHLDTGNAGALDIFVDGAEVPKLGGVGTVRKGVVLDAERLIAGTATDR